MNGSGERSFALRPAANAAAACFAVLPSGSGFGFRRQYPASGERQDERQQHISKSSGLSWNLSDGRRSGHRAILPSSAAWVVSRPWASTLSVQR